MTGYEMGWLGRRLARCGFCPLRFPYSSLRAGVAENAASLIRFCAGHRLQSPHIVAHSLGGLIVLRALCEAPDLPIARIVLLGTPITGSIVARRLASRRWMRPLFRSSLAEGLAGGARVPHECRNVGVIAGTHALGIGRLSGALARANDGAVTVAETDLPGAGDAIRLPTNHIGLLLSREVAGRCCQFLHHGSFTGSAALSSPQGEC
jgi:pimeloyl-ACP methyl ester carboxylesterase